MKVISVLSVLILSLSVVDAQFFNLAINVTDLFPSSFHDPLSSNFPAFPDFKKFVEQFAEWEKGMQNRLKEVFKGISTAFSKDFVKTVNGTTTLTQKIGGQTYTGTIPAGKSYFLSSSTLMQNGTTMEIVKIVADGKTSIYKTMDGKTTVTDEKGKQLDDGGFFGVKLGIGSGQIKGADSSKDIKVVQEKPTKPVKKPTSNI